MKYTSTIYQNRKVYLVIPKEQTEKLFRFLFLNNQKLILNVSKETKENFWLEITTGENNNPKLIDLLYTIKQFLNNKTII